MMLRLGQLWGTAALAALAVAAPSQPIRRGMRYAIFVHAIR
jgi:hypothetical protein